MFRKKGRKRDGNNLYYNQNFRNYVSGTCLQRLVRKPHNESPTKLFLEFYPRYKQALEFGKFTTLLDYKNSVPYECIYKHKNKRIQIHTIFRIEIFLKKISHTRGETCFFDVSKRYFKMILFFP